MTDQTPKQASKPEPLKPEKIAELQKLVNDSGFPFQLRVEYEVRAAMISWSVASREHPWMDRKRDPHKEYFLDLVLESGRQRMAVECKRSQDASWVFLTDPTETIAPDVGRQQIRARVFYTGKIGEKETRLSTWWNFDVRPTTVESEFCIVRGTGDDRSPLLERLGRQVVDASEEVGELALTLGEAVDVVVVIPVIVTSAKLYVCPADPALISLQEGKLSEAAFHEIPYIRFRKSLSQRMTKDVRKVRSIGEADDNRARTVFVVNSESLIPFLKTWSLKSSQDWGWPHDRIKPPL